MDKSIMALQTGSIMVAIIVVTLFFMARLVIIIAIT